MSEVTTGTRHLTASAVVLDTRNELVLLVDHKAEGKRQFPGGHVDADETPCEAAMREVLEETGVVAWAWPVAGQWLRVPGGRVHPRPIAVVEFPAPAKPHKVPAEPKHFHVDELFVATADSTAPVAALLTEVSGAHWVSIHDLGEVRADVPMMVDLAWRTIFYTYS